ncbi:MAG: hypothetical protein PHI35_09675 [Victivallaceae bacterium]|nr:hypothetical protein [Victivallaceae bacterium]
MSIICPHCGEKTLPREKTVRDGLTAVGVRLVCPFCGGDLGEPPKSEAAVKPVAADSCDRLAALLGEVEKTVKADLAPDEDYGRFCRNCGNFLAHPFKCVCARDHREVDPMGECEFFSKKEE